MVLCGQPPGTYRVHCRKAENGSMNKGRTPRWHKLQCRSTQVMLSTQQSAEAQVEAAWIAGLCVPVGADAEGSLLGSIES
jgi:hypothetical protein